MANKQRDGHSGSRKKQLNVVYFIDSSRTRTFRMSLTRLNILLAAFALLIVWSIGSVFLLLWVGAERQLTSERLHSTMATLFDYEARYDGAYEVAYPLDSKGRPSIAATTVTKNPMRAEVKPASPQTAAKSSVKAPNLQAAANTTARSGNAVLASVSANNSDGTQGESSFAVKENNKISTGVVEKSDTQKHAAPAIIATTVTPVSPAKAAATAGVPGLAAEAALKESPIKIDNPVLELGTRALELRFDIRSRGNARAEGYVWAVAEYKTDSGKNLYIGAPPSIEVQANGEPLFPKKSNKFAVRYFKRKKLSFPIDKKEPGTFVGIKIGVMSNTGDDRMNYKVPVNIRTDKGTSSVDATNKHPG